MANTGTSQVSTTRSHFLIRQLLENAMPRFVHAMFAQMNDLPRNQGISVKFNKYASLSAATTALSEGITPDSTQQIKTSINATPLLYGAYTISTDYLKMTVEEDYPAAEAMTLGDQFGDTIDQLTATVLAAGDTVLQRLHFLTPLRTVLLQGSA